VQSCGGVQMQQASGVSPEVRIDRITGAPPIISAMSSLCYKRHHQRAREGISSNSCRLRIVKRREGIEPRVLVALDSKS
jgi:hypothetical protein